MKAVTLLEILRSYSEAYPTAAHALALIEIKLSECREKNSEPEPVLLDRLYGHLMTLLEHCDHLPVTAKSARRLADIVNSDKHKGFEDPHKALSLSIIEIQTRLTDELSLNLFFQLPIAKKKYFDNPTDGWQEVLHSFLDATLDVEEMSRCFALSRYAASVFHSVAVIEVGLIHLGRVLSVNDPLSGWTAVTGALQKVLDKKYETLSPFEKQHRPFFEQMNAVTQAVKSAWRNKISHTQGKLVVMTSDFSPDVAEEIMIATRSFMRRLATEMPELEKT